MWGSNRSNFDRKIIRPESCEKAQVTGRERDIIQERALVNDPGGGWEIKRKKVYI